MKCEFCKQEKLDVRVKRDPFSWEINDEDWQVAMCDDCEQLRYDEI